MEEHKEKKSTDQVSQTIDNNKPNKNEEQELEEWYYNKLSSDMETVLNYVKIAREMMSVSRDPKMTREERILAGKQFSKNEILSNIISKLRGVQSRLMVLVVELTNELFLDSIIKLNEHVRVTIEWYQYGLSGKEFTVVPKELCQLPPSNITELMDLSKGEGKEKKEEKEKIKKEKNDPSNIEPLDEFDLIAMRDKENSISKNIKTSPITVINIQSTNSNISEIENKFSSISIENNQNVDDNKTFLDLLQTSTEPAVKDKNPVDISTSLFDPIPVNPTPNLKADQSRKNSDRQVMSPTLHSQPSPNLPTENQELDFIPLN